MNDKVLTLATKPTVEQSIKDDVINILEKTLVLARDGEIESLVMIVGSPGGYWREESSGSIRFSETIGRLEIKKHQMIMSYLQKDTDGD